MVDVAGLAIEGVSVGGHETCLIVPTWKLAIDVGRCPRRAVNVGTVLFTHAHADHMGGVIHHCATRAMLRMPPPRYVVPRVKADAFRRHVEVWRELDGGALPYELVELAPGEDVELRRGLRVRAYHAPHRAPCQGYVFYDEREKLRPELDGAPADELAARRRAGERLTETLAVPELAVSGDTLLEGVLACPDALRARRLALEVSFLDERVTPAQAHEMGHVHLDDVIAHADAFENEALLFTHLSARYRPAEARALLAERLPASLRGRVIPFLPPWRA
ncbi:MAG: hypothetical protein H6828_05840 [Planctomycetes bacterium]|nr:hypothetical protein [Planctomycetota bacterium]